MNLPVGGHVRNVSRYQLVQQQFPVTHPVEERNEVENWDITIAFPLRSRVTFAECTGDIFAFLSSELASGFPFVVNADFLLVSSRETLKFNSPWNVGILSCLPRVFLTAFLRYFLQLPNAVEVRRAYQYIPVEQPQHPEFQKVRQRILGDLKGEDCVLIDSRVGYVPIPSLESGSPASNLFCKPEMCRLISAGFRVILEAASAEGNPNPSLMSSPWCIVDGEVQSTYSKALEELGVPQMTEEEYAVHFKYGSWLLRLSEDLYWRAVFFVLRFCKSSTSGRQMRTVPILKYCKEDGSIALASVQTATAESGAKIYFSPSQEEEWLSSWTSALSHWVPLLFMPQSTVRTLKNLLPGKTDAVVRDYLSKVVLNLSAKSYLWQLQAKLQSCKDPMFVILTTEFMYQSLQKAGVKEEDCLTGKYLRLVDQSAQIWTVNKQCGSKLTFLLPATGSMWPKLILNNWSKDMVVLSKDYIIPPSTWPRWLGTCIWNKVGLDELKSFRAFLSRVTSASDIPNIAPPAGSSFRMPRPLQFKMTVDQASLLLMWLTNVLSRQSVLDGNRSQFFQTVMETE